MGDPGFVAGLVGYAVAKLLDQAIKAVKQAKNCSKYRKNLEVLLQSIKPLVSDMEAGSSRGYASGSDSSSHGRTSSQAVADWLAQLEELLQEAVELLHECNQDTRNLNMLASYKMSKSILSITMRIKELAGEHAPLATLAKLGAMEVSMQELSMQLSRLELSVITRECCLQGGQMNQETVFNEIKSRTDSLTSALQVEGRRLSGRQLSRDSISSQRRSFSPSPDRNDGIQELSFVSRGESAGSVSKSSARSFETGRNSFASGQDLEPEPDFVFGTDDAMNRLLGFLLSGENGSQWVGIWGKGGIGKTLLAQRVKNNPRVHNYFTGMTFWLTVGREPSVERLQVKLCEKIGIQVAVATKEDYKKNLRNALRGRKFLLVLDDVWEDDGRPILEWMDVVSREELGSRILVTTRNLDVLERVHAADEATIRMQRLNDLDSWKLFCQHAFGGADKRAGSKSFQSLVKEVVSECKGLPLALKVVARALASQKSEEQWQRALSKLREAEILNQDHELLLYQRVQLSYDALIPIDPRLQKCFLYFAAFPEDEVVKVEYLVDLWAGEGLLQPNEYNDLMPDAYFLVGVLIGRSLIDLSYQSNRYMRMQWCQIHDVLRDFALYTLQLKRNVYAYECLFKAGKGLASFPWSTDIKEEGDSRNRNSSKKLVLAATRISLVDNSLKALPSRLRAPSLKVLLLRKNKPLKAIPPSFLEGFPELKVLDLSRTNLETLPSSIGDLVNLCHLDLSANTSLRKLPSSLKKLRNLKFLSVQGCSGLEPLSFEVSYLKSLRSLNTAGCRGFWEEKVTGPVLRRTRSKIKLPLIPRQRIASLDSLCSLSRLADLRIESARHESLPARISSLDNLQVLKVSFESLISLPDDLETSIVHQLQILDVSFCRALVSLPPWMPSLTQLVTLDLRRCSGLTSLPDLHKLPRLQRLYLNDCKGISELPSKFACEGAFPALQELWMEDCNRLEEFPPIGKGAFEMLLQLKLSGCSSLRRLPTSLSSLPNLGHLDLSRCTGITSLDDCIPDASLVFDSCKTDAVEDCPGMSQIPGTVDDDSWAVKADSSCQLASFYCFRKLEELKLKDVPLDHLPSRLSSLPTLKTLDLGNRPMLLTPQLAQLQMLGVIQIT